MTAGLLLLALAAALLLAGTELFVDNVRAAAGRLGLTVLAVGILLAGAEPEELLTAVLASTGGHPGLAAGDALGADVTMLTATLGLAALIRPVPVGRQVRRYAVMASGAGVLGLLAVLDGRVARWEGALLVTAYVGGVAVVWRRERRPPVLGELAETETEPEDGTEDGRPRRGATAALALSLLGLAVMAAGGKFAVSGASRVAVGLGLADSAVGLTLLALATTAELFALVVVAARRGLAEVAVAGVVGSAAYNPTLTLGVAALARPLRTGSVTVPAALGAALPLLVVLLARGGSLRRPAGALLAAGYVAYLVFVLRR